MNTVFSVRASSWSQLFNCAYAWEGVHLLGMKSPSSPRALLGTAIHAGTAAFDQSRIDGTGLTPYDASEAVVNALRDPEQEVNWRGSDLSQRDAERIALALHSEYCVYWSPRYQFEAVELTTKPFLIDCGNGVHIQLTGQLDRSRLIATSGKPRIGDLKSGAQAVTANGTAATGKHRAQLGTYELLYEHTTGVEVDSVSEVIGMATSGKPRIATGEAHGCKQLMTGTAEYKGLIEIASQMFASGIFPPNPQAHTCSEKYCPRYKQCPYHA